MTPMPPPKPSPEGPRVRQVFHEIGQIVRALEAHGPTTPEDLREVVGGRWWEEHRFDRALALAASDGMVHTTDDGKVAAT